MPVNRELNLVFIHIPKTGGSAIENFFDMNYEESFYKPKHMYWEGGIHYCMQHLTYFLLEEKFNKLDEYITFSCVRNPYDRVVSEYFYKFPNKKFNRQEFDMWLFNFLSVFREDHQLPQHRFICDNNDNILVDHLLYFESLQKDFNNFLEKNNFYKDELEVVRKSNRDTNFNKYLTDENKKMIYNTYKKDFKIFGY